MKKLITAFLSAVVALNVFAISTDASACPGRCFHPCSGYTGYGYTRYGHYNRVYYRHHHRHCYWYRGHKVCRYYR